MSKLFLIPFLALFISSIFLIRIWDRRSPEPWKNIGICFAFGLLAVMVERFIFRFTLCKVFFDNDLIEFIVRLNDEFVPWKDNPAYGSAGRLLFSGFVVGGILKEGMKFLALSYLLQRFRLDIDEPRDPLVYAFSIGLGFALLDAFFHYYIDMLSFRKVGDVLDYFRFDFSWVLLRLFTVHFAGSMFTGLGFAFAMDEIHYETAGVFRRFSNSFLRRNRKLYILFGFILAVVVHAVTTLSFGARQWGWIGVGVVVVLSEMWLIGKVMKKLSASESFE